LRPARGAEVSTQLEGVMLHRVMEQAPGLGASEKTQMNWRREFTAHRTKIGNFRKDDVRLHRVKCSTGRIEE
jgi:hypothetical protein